jgi:hypothetical protein
VKTDRSDEGLMAGCPGRCPQLGGAGLSSLVSDLPGTSARGMLQALGNRKAIAKLIARVRSG